MKRLAVVAWVILMLLMASYPVVAESNASEKRRLAKKVEELVERYGNPLNREGIEYLGVSISADTGSVSHMYSDIDGKKRNKPYMRNRLFNLSDVDPTSIRVYDNIRWWTIDFSMHDGKQMTIRGETWDHKTDKIVKDWWADDRMPRFCGTQTEGKAREIADYLRSLVKLYQ